MACVEAMTNGVGIGLSLLIDGGPTIDPDEGPGAGDDLLEVLILSLSLNSPCSRLLRYSSLGGGSPCFAFRATLITSVGYCPCSEPGRRSPYSLGARGLCIADPGCGGGAFDPIGGG